MKINENEKKKKIMVSEENSLFQLAQAQYGMWYGIVSVCNLL